MTKKYNIAIAGATGVVGTEMLNTLIMRKFPFDEVRLLASADSKGEVYDVAGQEVVVDELNKNSFKNIDIALFATSAKLSEEFVPVAVESGAWAIDNSSHFRMKDGIPLVVPEVNMNAVDRNVKIVANPNCSTIQLMPILKVMNEEAGIERVVVSTYQSVSGAGKDALDELFSQTRAIFNQQSFEPEAFLHQIAFNCIPQIDVFMEDGYTKEEYKIINESRKILNIPDLRITATAVRVPVFFAHAESVNVEFKRSFNLDQLINKLSKTKGIQVLLESNYPMQINAAGQDDIYIGRIRLDHSLKNGINFWVVADNVRKGAALNAVQIAEELIEKKYI
jgi:aspartate-semialdehyde dehydrogenase